MSIMNILKMAAAASRVIIMGQPEETDIMDSDNKPYYACNLKNTITVRCSVDKNILPYETDEVLIREDALSDDSLEIVFVNGKDETDGWFIKGWVADFSKGQQEVVYQETSIREWVRGNRNSRADERTSSINKRIEEAKRKRDEEGDDSDLGSAAAAVTEPVVPKAPIRRRGNTNKRGS